jgi:hypothetical protein
MRIFFDRSAPIGLARMVRGVEGDSLLIVHHDEDGRFHPKTEDTEWLRALGGDGAPLWIVISGDGRILKNRAEKQVLDEVALPFICLDGGWPRKAIYEYAWRFMKAWPSILAEAKAATRGRIYRVHSGASLKVERQR